MQWMTTIVRARITTNWDTVIYFWIKTITLQYSKVWYTKVVFLYTNLKSYFADIQESFANSREVHKVW